MKNVALLIKVRMIFCPTVCNVKRLKTISYCNTPL